MVSKANLNPKIILLKYGVVILYKNGNPCVLGIFNYNYCNDCCKGSRLRLSE